MATGLLVGILVVPAAVWASHQFADVPDHQPFHTQIGAIKDAGITSGSTECGSPPPGQTSYCPESLVRRDAMAAFMHRGYGRAGAGTHQGTTTTDGLPHDAATLLLDTGGVAGGTGFVLVSAAFTGWDLGGGFPCPCGLNMGIRMSNPDGSDGTTSPFIYADIPAVANPAGYAAGATTNTWVFEVPTGVQKKFTVEYVVYGDTTGPDDVIDIRSEITALYVPFSADGDDTLAP